MGEIVVRAEGLSKHFTLGQRWQHDTLRDHLVRSLGAFSRRQQEPRRDQTFWALRDVSFEVKQGEAIGIIGSNGAGKSTLLKILSRITEPTAGYAEVQGRVGTLLEVGAGFHPELTGRENIYLNGAIMGMKKREIDLKRDAIIAFAGVEPFIDTPVKRYSTGMRLRLAFAVAAHLEQEILFVDEVLAVGDAEFQRKCMGKMGQVSTEGRTVLFVSHNMAAIADLCPRALWLKDGRVRLDGASADVVSAYLSSTPGVRAEWSSASCDFSDAAGFQFAAARVLSEGNQPVAVTGFTSPFKLQIEYQITRPMRDFSIIYSLVDSRGAVVWTSWDSDGRGWATGEIKAVGRYVSTCVVPGCLLKPGLYRVNLGARNAGEHFPAHDNALSFEISEVGFPLNPGRRGVITPLLTWDVERVSNRYDARPTVEPSGVRKIR